MSQIEGFVHIPLSLSVEAEWLTVGALEVDCSGVKPEFTKHRVNLGMFSKEWWEKEGPVKQVEKEQTVINLRGFTGINTHDA